jgi:hypothetical protein
LESSRRFFKGSYSSLTPLSLQRHKQQRTQSEPSAMHTGVLMLCLQRPVAMPWNPISKSLHLPHLMHKHLPPQCTHCFTTLESETSFRPRAQASRDMAVENWANRLDGQGSTTRSFHASKIHGSLKNIILRQTHCQIGAQNARSALAKGIETKVHCARVPQKLRGASLRIYGSRDHHHSAGGFIGVKALVRLHLRWHSCQARHWSHCHKNK